LIENDGGEIMSEQDKEKDKKAEETSQEEAQTQEAILAEQEQAQEKEAPQKLAEAEVGEAVDATKLPDFAKAALKARQYADEAELKEAIESAIKEVAKLTGSGQPFGQGTSEVQGDKPISERERIIRFNKHLEAVGGRPVPVPAE